MKEILQENSDAVRQAGEALVEIGTELAAGRIENALGRLEAAQQQYLAWAELDQAIIDIQEAVHDRKNTLAVQQILIGIALGFTMQFAFAAVRTAGEIIGLQMGLSFATFVDPASHLNMPVLARIMDMLALLLFLTFNGHLWLISLLVDTFHTLPIGGEPLNSNAFLALTKAGSLIFLNGLMLALPLITLLLTLNLALGLLNRMAPQLSIFVIGFPLTLTVGISLMAALMPLIAPFCEHLFSEMFNLLADIISELPLI